MTDVDRMAVIAHEWTITVCPEHGQTIQHRTSPGACIVCGAAARRIEVVPAEQLRGAVEALREIVAHSEMPAGESWPSAYIQVVFMARDALDRIKRQS